MKEKFSIGALALSIVGGLIWGILGGVIYRVCLNAGLWRPLTIGIYFAGLALVGFVSIILINTICRLGNNESSDILVSLALVVAVFVVAMLGQFLYQLEPKVKQSKDSSYIFLVDISSSTSWNDPSGERAKAAQAILNAADADFPVALLSFNERLYVDNDFAPAGSYANKKITFGSDGGTLTDLGLNAAYNYISSNSKSAGSSPKLILISDGAELNLDYRLRALLGKMKNDGITVCTVGFGSDSYMQHLETIASLTGGNFTQTNDASELVESTKWVINTNSSFTRDLINQREVETSFLYGILRVFILLVISAVFFLIKVKIVRSDDSASRSLVFQIICAVIGALIIEIGMNMLMWSVVWTRILMCILITALFLFVRRGPVASTADYYVENTNPWGSGGDSGSGSSYGADGSSYWGNNDEQNYY